MLFQTRSFQVCGIICLAVFLAFFTVRLGLFKGKNDRISHLVNSAAISQTVGPSETYIAMLQNGRHIGYSHENFLQADPQDFRDRSFGL